MWEATPGKSLAWLCCRSWCRQSISSGCGGKTTKKKEARRLRSVSNFAGARRRQHRPMCKLWCQRNFLWVCANFLGKCGAQINTKSTWKSKSKISAKSALFFFNFEILNLLLRCHSEKVKNLVWILVLEKEMKEKCKGYKSVVECILIFQVF